MNHCRVLIAAADRAVYRHPPELPSDDPVVLLPCGGFGVGPTERLFDELTTMAPLAARSIARPDAAGRIVADALALLHEPLAASDRVLA